MRKPWQRQRGILGLSRRGGAIARVWSALTILIALLVLPASMACAGATAPGEVSVTVKGALPGFRDGELSPYLAGVMNAAGLAGWHFAPSSAGRAAPNRIEISFATNSYAAGNVRSFGFARATLDRLLNIHHMVTIEARLFLNDQYETLFFEQVTMTGGPRDRDLDSAVTKLTRILTAFPALNISTHARRRFDDGRARGT